MARHTTRNERGQFTKSGAPIDPDNSVYEHVDALSGRPGQDPEMFPEFRAPYPVHDFSKGPVTRLLPQRHAVMIDAETGQQMAYRVDHEMRGVDTLMGGNLREQAHLQAAAGDPFASNLMSRPGCDFNRRGHEHMGDTPGVDNDNATHTTWPGQVGKPMRDR
jgi:hypothetical protein